MRSFSIKRLAVLLSLALASGNAHAALHLGEAFTEPCPEEQSHHIGKTSPRHHQHNAGLACCCDCLGCVSAVSLTPDLASIGAAVFGTTIRYTDTAQFLPDRVLPPEPDPPRPSA